MSQKPTAVIVIPTYNEATQTPKMIDHLFKKTFPTIKDWNCVLFYVDGNSPDGTAEVIRSKQKKYPNLKLLVETKKEGIGAAYVKAFTYAMDKLKADAVIEFDGDFQHPPKTVKLMLDQVSLGYDYVLGSRKIKGGSNPKGWGFKRLFLSEMGGLVARTILFFPTRNFFRVTDPTTGLKATRVKGFADTIDMKHLYTKSFGYKLEFLYKTIQLGAKVKEVPLKFGLREAGESKIEPQTAKEIFRTVIHLRLNDLTTRKFIKFGTIGLFGFVINKLGLDFFSGVLSKFIPIVGVRNTFANAFAAEFSIISNFTFNNLWTFKNEKLFFGRRLIKKFAAFNLSSVLSGIVLPSLVIGAGTHFFGDEYRTLFLILGVGFITVPLNWFVYNKVIWKKVKK